MLNEDPYGVARRMVGRRFVGNKLCLPVHIQMEPVPAWLWWLTRPGMLNRWLLRASLFLKRGPRPTYSKLSIQEYLEWPGLTVIGIHRNPVDTIQSMQARGSQSASEAERRWTEAIRTIHGLWQTVPERVILVGFEKLVTEPRRVLEALLSRLGLYFDSDCLDGYKYTPFYAGRPGIEPERARTGPGQRFHHRVFEQDSELCDMYGRLCQYSV